jgi:hypothetical protein
MVREAHDVGSRVMLQVTTVAQTVRAAERGFDVIIAQGGESGGYCGEVSTMALVPQVVDAVSPIPVVAAGCVYQKPKLGHSADEARRGSRVTPRCSRPAERDEMPAHLCSMTDAF